LFNPRMLLSVFKEWAVLKARRYGRRFFGMKPAFDQPVSRQAGARRVPVATNGSHERSRLAADDATIVDPAMSRELISLPVLDPEATLDPHAGCCHQTEAVSEHA